MKDRKKIKKTVVKGIASEGHAKGGKEGLGGWDRQRFGTPRPRQAGRADCLRFASPAEAD